jgi:regulator of protease activity HflC (stomatin/prohibitin superfamily)
MISNQNEEQAYLDIWKKKKEQEAARKAAIKRKIKIGGAIFGAILFIFGITQMVGYKDSTELIVKQSPFGKMSCVDGQGFYIKNFSSTTTFQKATSFYFHSDTTKVKGKEWEGNDTDEDAVEVTLSRNSKAWISAYLMYELPNDCESLIKLKNKHHNDAQIKHDLVRNAVMSGILKTAPMFTAEAAKVTNLAELQALAYDQITVGEYLTTTRTDKELVSEEERDTSGKVTKKAEYAEYKVTELKLDSLGNRIIATPSTLNEFGVKVTQFQIRGIVLDSVSQNQLDVIKKRETQRVSNITEAETAKQAAITNEANGRANAAKAKWSAEAVKARVIVEMEQARDSARLVAERERDVARLNAEKAKFIADSTKQAGIAEAEANRAKRAAGLTPQEEAQNKKDIAIGIAEKLANSQGMWTPYIYNGGTGSNAGPGSQFGMALEIDMIKKVSELSKMMQQ